MKTIEKKEPYLKTLNTRGNIYEEFLPDQVLTHKNLNKVVNYFEDQDRMSRVYLIGVGVGCGLNIVSYTNSYIEIGQGVGVTTDGDIIKTETRGFHYYSVLTDRASYELFDGLQVYEIHAQEEAGRLTDELPLSSFTSNEPGVLKDYIVVAYVENYTEDEGLCGGTGCDETGNKVYSNLKFLLIHKNDKDALVASDTIYNSHDVLSYYDTLPELCFPRLLLKPENTTSGVSIHNQFTASFSLKDELKRGINTIIDNFSHRINFARYNITTAQITTYLDTIFVAQLEPNIQYKYDLLKDLIDTYREIRDLILSTRFECVANINAFPKHLLLGTLEEATRLHTRHEFYPSPTVSENDENLLAIKALCIKFFNQLKEYKIPNVSSAAVKITPSKSYEYKLSERSIPYYYETKNSLISNWNPLAIQLRKLKKHLGYHVSNLMNIPCVQNPLEYNHLDKDFYRIEGHIGKDFRSALRKINSLKTKYNLAFDVKAVSIGFPVNKVSLDDDKCNTKDYSILLETWEQEFCCTAESATEFFQEYLYNDQGNNGTSATVYSMASQQQGQVLQLFNKNKPATEASKNPPKIEGRTINTNMEALETGQSIEVASYENSIRYIMDQAYTYVGTQDAPAGYVASVALGIIGEIQGTVNTGSDYYFYTEVPIKIIAGLAEIKNNFLASLDEVYVTEKWTALNDSIDRFCAFIDTVLLAISEVEDGVSYGTLTHDKMYEYFIYELSKLCCLKGKFTWLKTQIDDIRNNLYREVILSRLIEKHPGAEHMAGVPKGGTFLMVYLGGTEELLEDDTVLSRFNGIVQFDFALPYMCCSDCPPETIVYNAERDLTLSIEKTKYCLPTDDAQVDFITGDSSDVVTSPEGEGYIVPTDSGYAFDPTGVPEDLIGQPLTFLVNGSTPVVPVEICVYKLPTNVAASYNNAVWDTDGLTVGFEVTHNVVAYPYNFTYTWKRASGEEIGTGSSLSFLFPSPDGDAVEEVITVTVGIEENPVACTIDAEVTVQETRPVPVSVTVVPLICHNLMETSPAWTQVFVTPDGATLSSPQIPIDGLSFIEQDNDGNYFINPLNVPNELAGEEIQFSVDGELIEGVTTRVMKLPFAINTDTPEYEVISWDDTGVNLNIGARHIFQTEEYIEYRWTDLDNDNTQIGDSRNLTDFRINDLGEGIVIVNYRVSMRVIGLEESCVASFDVGFTLERPTLDIPRGICFGQSVQLTVSPEDTLTSPQGDFFENISDTIFFRSALVPNDLVGQTIEIFVNGSRAATTVVYKVPIAENIDANYELVRREGDDLIVRLVVSYTIPGVTNHGNYIEVTWFDNTGSIVAETEEHRIDTAGDAVNLTYKVVVSVRPELLGTPPCETIPIDVIINEDAPEPELPTHLGILGKYCWKIGSPNLNISIPVSPNDFVITSPQGSSLVQANTVTHTFRAHLVSNALAGEEIQFEINGTTVDTTRIFKLPIESNIDYNQQESGFVGDSFVFKIQHDLDDKEYLDYDVVEFQSGAPVEQIERGTFRFPAQGFINQEFRVTVFVTGLDCSSTARIIIEEVDDTPDPIGDPFPNPGGGTTNLGRLNCNTSYNDRLTDLGFVTDLKNLEVAFRSQPYNEVITTQTVKPIKDIVTLMTNSSDIVNDSIGAISTLNGLRDQLNRQYLRNPNFNLEKGGILQLDELMEIMSLEMLRCIDENNAELTGIFNDLITISDGRATDYGEGSRSKITQEYLSSFSTKGDGFKNAISNTFTK